VEPCAFALGWSFCLDSGIELLHSTDPCWNLGLRITKGLGREVKRAEQYFMHAPVFIMPVAVLGRIAIESIELHAA
jgi:hypothetical protein